MRRYRLSLCLVLALAGLAYSGSNASAQSWCAVQTAVHSNASLWLNGKKLTQCMAGAAGCKCVSCYTVGGAVYSACYPLVAAIPH
jgi:hypothetical protein